MPEASPKRRADKRAQVFVQHLDGAADAADLKLVRPRKSLMLTSLRRSHFESARVVDIMDVVQQLDKVLTETPARRARSEKDSRFRVYAEQQIAKGHVYSSTMSTGKSDIALKIGYTLKNQFLAQLDLPLAWAVAKLPANRHLQSDRRRATENVLFAEVLLPGAELERCPPLTTWLEVVPSVEDTETVDTILGGLWPHTNFRGIRSLWNVVNDRFLGIGIADVERFLRKQELRQMVQPRVAAVATPLVATELGWHQVDIMYATWVKGAQTDLEKALEKNALEPAKLLENEEAQLVAIGDQLQRENKVADDEKRNNSKRKGELQAERNKRATINYTAEEKKIRDDAIDQELAEIKKRDKELKAEDTERDKKREETYERIDKLRKEKRDRRNQQRDAGEDEKQRGAAKSDKKDESESSEYESDTNYISEEEAEAETDEKQEPKPSDILEQGNSRRMTRGSGVDVEKYSKAAAEKAKVHKSRGGRAFKYILNVMDIFSKYAWSFPLRDMTAETVAKELEGLWLREGAPKKLQSDGGFRSYAVDHLARRFGVELATCAPYHSQCSGAIERLNRTVRESVKRLRHAYSSNHDWTSLLPTILSSYNAQKHTTTQLSPFLLQRGHEPRALRAVYFDPRKSKPINPELAVIPQVIYAKNEDAAKQARADVHECLAEVVSNLDAGLLGGANATPSDVQDAVAQTAARTLARLGLLESETKNAKTDIAVTEQYLQNYAVSRDKRNAFAAQGIRHGALAMTTDALIRAEKSMEPLETGTLVRISFEHTNKSHRAEIKVGLKRAEDRHTWGSAIYCVTDKPLVQLWLGSGKEGSEDPSSQRCALQQSEGVARYGNVYTVYPCLPSQLSEENRGARFVPRQDLLKISDSRLDSKLVNELKTSFSESRMQKEIEQRVTLRDHIKSPASFL